MEPSYEVVGERRGCPVTGFDHNSSEHASDPVASYRRLRATGPLTYTNAHGGYYVLASYEHVFEAARDDGTFSSARSDHGGDGLAIVIPKVPMHHHIPIELDPPEFRPYRKVLNPKLTPQAVEDFQPIIDRWVDFFIDNVIEAGECDFGDIIGVPAAITIEWLGMDADNWRQFSRAIHLTLASIPGSKEAAEARDHAMPWLQDQVREHIAYRRREPGDDLVSYLLASEVFDRPLTDEEVFSMVELLISGGVGTTASLVGQTLVHLSQHTDDRQALIDDPSKMDIAVEEFLRVFSPTQALARTVTSDTEFKGCPMSEGDRVLLSWASANRDPAQFEDPDTVDIERWPNRHAAFGVGMHRCVGSHLGRAMSRTLLQQILERMPDFEIDTTRLVPYANQGTNTGYTSIPATFTPGARKRAATQER